MEIAITHEILPDQCGADHLAVVLDQAALGLRGKQRLPKLEREQRIKQPRDEREQDEKSERAAQHSCHQKMADDHIDRS